jgi:WD repeat-containing protein 23
MRVCLCVRRDRRVISDNSGEREVTGSPAQPVAVFQGHQAGVTHVDSKQDGNYFISNGKDQCIKLWDIRRNTPGGADVSVAQPQWDYRHGEHSRPAFGKKQEGDTSVMTYRGHCVRETLIRSYFSPLETTGQRYIATGCYTGSVFVYDVLSGEVAKRLTFNRATVRDVSWHPRRPILVTASWDGTTLTLNAQSGKQGQQPKNVLAREVEGGPGGGMYW